MPPLGFVTQSQRTQAQNDAHVAAVGAMRQFALPVPQLARGERLCLFDFWKRDEVVAEVGLTWDRIHQLTGSCVWAGGTNALFSTIAAQRVAGKSRAFLPFTLHNYALSRHAVGWDSPGEGSLGSTFAASLEKDGVEDWRDSAIAALAPTFRQGDGISVTSQDEYKWSSVKQSPDEVVVRTSRNHLLGSATPAMSAIGARALILNGVGVSFACDRFIGHGAVRGTGDEACVVGRWDSSGGHQQSLHAFWEHPSFGPMYWAQNNWPGSTYPRDPAGGPVCGVWVLEADLDAAFRYGSEVFGLSNLNWIAPTPELLTWVF